MKRRTSCWNSHPACSNSPSRAAGRSSRRAASWRGTASWLRAASRVERAQVVLREEPGPDERGMDRAPGNRQSVLVVPDPELCAELRTRARAARALSDHAVLLLSPRTRAARLAAVSLTGARAPRKRMGRAEAHPLLFLHDP